MYQKSIEFVYSGFLFLTKIGKYIILPKVNRQESTCLIGVNVVSKLFKFEFELADVGDEEGHDPAPGVVERLVPDRGCVTRNLSSAQ